MFARASEKWSTSLLYGVSSLCAFSGMVMAAVHGDLPLDTISLSFGTGVVLWTGAAMQELYRAYTRAPAAEPQPAKESEIAPDSASASTVTVRNQWRPSTHTMLNSFLHVSASTSLLVSDSVAATKAVTLVLGTRIAGSALWLKGAALTHGSARGQARREENPELNAEVCGVNQAKINLVIELEYLAAAILYAIANYSDPTTRNNPLKIAGNSCWILAGLYDTLHAVYKCYEKTNSEISVSLIHSDPADNVSIQVNEASQQPTTPPSLGRRS